MAKCPDIYVNIYICIRLETLTLIPGFNINNNERWLYIWDTHFPRNVTFYYNDVMLGTMASQITSLAIFYSITYAGQRKHQNSASLAFVCGIHRWPVNSLQKSPVTRKMFLFDDIIMLSYRVYTMAADVLATQGWKYVVASSSHIFQPIYFISSKTLHTWPCLSSILCQNPS